MSRKPRILLADDEVALRASLVEFLSGENMEVTSTGNGAEALDLLRRHDYDLLISDIKMPGLDGLSLLRKANELNSNLSVILITAYGTLESAIEAMRLGAADYILKPLLLEDLLVKARRLLQMRDLRRENRRLRAEVDRRERTLVGDSPAIRDMMALVDKVARTWANVLIVGESGTGKELVARAVHARGITADGPFVPVNCGGIQDTLFESAMFGHRRGAFTGAVRDTIGFFEAANGGTLFLDEIGNLPMHAQMSMLRAVEDRAITPVGDTRAIPIELRIISATNVDPATLVARGTFREDLRFRLEVVRLTLPPLRERPGDIPLLVDHFIRKYNAEMKRACTGIRDDAMQSLLAHPWKGNIRELENVIERALIFAEDRDIEPADLPFGPAPITGGAPGGDHPRGPADLPHLPESLEEAGRIFERRHIGAILRKHAYDKAQAARVLGISVPSLYRKIHDLDLPMQAGEES